MKQKRIRSASIAEHFCNIQDPRIERTRYHMLIDIIVIAVCAIICGAKSWDDIETFGKEKYKWLKKFLELPNGIPSHDTFNRVFTRLDPEQFRAGFMSWIQVLVDATKGEIVAIDGKTLRRSHNNGQDAIHMISAWACANSLVLGQQKVSGKSNEITAIPKLLKLLELTGAIVTIDAMGCQTIIAKTIIKQGADYILAVKGNQKNLHRDIKLLFAEMKSADDYHKTSEKKHGRFETRECWTISNSAGIHRIDNHQAWKKLAQIAKIKCTRTVKEKTTVEIRYYISSTACGARKTLSAVRSHWAVENSLHWVLDVVFREDDSRARAGYSAENFAVLRHIAINLLKQEKSCNRSIRGKQLKSALSEEYLEKVMGI